MSIPKTYDDFTDILLSVVYSYVGLTRVNLTQFINEKIPDEVVKAIRPEWICQALKSLYFLNKRNFTTTMEAVCIINSRVVTLNIK